MFKDPRFQDLLRRLRTGDWEAAGSLWQEFEPAIRRTVRFQLRKCGLGGRDYSDERLQSAALLFLDRLQRGKLDELLTHLESPEQLLGLLRKMARGKVVDWLRQQNTGRRDERRNKPLDEQVNAPPAHDETPSQIAMHEELVQWGRAMLNEDERRIVELVCEGQCWPEIGARQGRSSEAVRKQFERAIARLKPKFDTGEGGDD